MDKFYELKHIEAAPEVVREAAKAVVRINNNATAFFVSNDGLLLTNNHVLGELDCALEGCSVRLDFDYQKGLNFFSEKYFWYKHAVKTEKKMGNSNLFTISNY